MQLAQFAKSYQSVAINTATPAQLILMLYDGALRFMAAAKFGFREENIGRRMESIHINLIKAEKIIRELQYSLDMKAGGEFAERMLPLYDFMVRQLQEANLKKQSAPIETVERLLGDIRNAWAEMLDKSATLAA